MRIGNDLKRANGYVGWALPRKVSFHTRLARFYAARSQGEALHSDFLLETTEGNRSRSPRLYRVHHRPQLPDDVKTGHEKAGNQAQQNGRMMPQQRQVRV